MPVYLFPLFILLPVGLSLSASTLSDEGTVSAFLGHDVVIPWTLRLDQGSTILNIVWRKDPATSIAQLFGTSFLVDAAYAERVSAVSNSTASIRLTNITEEDVGTYRCTATVNDGGTTVQLVDTQDLQISQGKIILNGKNNTCAGPSTDNTATFPWTYELSPGMTLDEIRWDRINDDGSPTLILRLRSGTITPGSNYADRSSTNATDSNGSAFLFLRGIKPADKGVYRCTVISSSLSGIFEDTTLGLAEIPQPVDAVDVKGKTESTVTVEWKENPISGICKEVPTFHVEYREDSKSSLWVSSGNVTGSADGNEIMTYRVTGLASNTSYIIGVTVINSQGASNRTETDPKRTDLGPPLVLAQASHSIYDALVGAFCTASASKGLQSCACDWLCAAIGPLIQAGFSIALIVSTSLLGDIQQGESIAIIVVSVIALILSIIAAILAILNLCKNNYRDSNFSYISLGFVIFVGLMMGITGTVLAIINIKENIPEYVAALAIGIIFSLAAAAVAICLICAMYQKKEPSKVSQDLSETSYRSQNQVQLQQTHHDETTRKSTGDVEPPCNEEEEHP